jgi:hypothetical protein
MVTSGETLIWREMIIPQLQGVKSAAKEFVRGAKR